MTIKWSMGWKVMIIKCRRLLRISYAIIPPRLLSMATTSSGKTGGIFPIMWQAMRLLAVCSMMRVISMV